jgi:uncharacterized membrane protein YccC
LVALVGYLDYSTGFEVSISFLYLIPIAVATWYVTGKAGYVVTFVSVVTVLLSNWAAGETYSREIIRFWNGFTRLMIFVMAIWLLQVFKRALAHERMLSQTDYLTGICQQPRALPTDPGQIQTSEPVQTPYQPRVYRPGWLQAGQRQVEAQLWQRAPADRCRDLSIDDPQN